MSGVEIFGIVALRNDSAVIQLDGARPQDHFEVRFVEDQFRFEYQVVRPEQVGNEKNIRSAFASTGYECLEWGMVLMAGTSIFSSSLEQILRLAL